MLLMLNVCSVVLLPVLQPVCSLVMISSACGFSLLSSAFSIALLGWLIRLNVRGWRFPFLGMVMIIDLVQGVCAIPLFPRYYYR